MYTIIETPLYTRLVADILSQTEQEELAFFSPKIHKRGKLFRTVVVVERYAGNGKVSENKAEAE